ncbi:MAG: hypothetical protein ACK5MR_03590 [Cumulibacter sp.]
MAGTSLATALADLPITRASALTTGAQSQPLTRGSEVEARYQRTLDGLAPLLGPGLRRGASYLVEGSTSLCLALAAGVSQGGSWCAAVGMPQLGLQAAAGLGVNLERFAVVPDPGSHWLEVTATLADAVDLILLTPPTRATDSDVRRLAARLRQRSCTLVVHANTWSGIEARLTVTDSQWQGASGDGRGYLNARHARVTVSGKGAPASERLWLPAPDGGVRRYIPSSESGRRGSQLQAVR